MLKRVSIVLLAVFMVVVNTNAGLPPKVNKVIAAIEAKKDKIQGGAVAIVYKGRVVYKTTFGHKRGKSGKVSADTLFPVGSLSKAISATAIALLVEKGQLDLNHLVKFPCMVNPVSMAHLLSHTTGYKFSGNWQIEHGNSRQLLLSKLAKHQPKCNPGKCYRYSNTTFSLTEEYLSSQGLNLKQAITLLRKSIGEQGIHIVSVPKGMDVAYPHFRDKKTRAVTALPMPPYYTKVVPASAGVFLSLNAAIQVLKLNMGYYPQVLSKETLAEMHKPYIANRDLDKWGLKLKLPCKKKLVKMRYGLGWRILSSTKHPGQHMIFHGGYINGINSFMGFIPSEDIGLVMLANEERVSLKTGTEFWKNVLEK